MTTTNKGLSQPARGSNVGVWDTPVNSNMDIIDASFGGTATVALTNSPVTLSSGQYQNVFITFTGALSGNCAITFPTVGSFYTIQNLTTNTSAFQVTLQTTAAGAQAIGCPWGEAFDIMTDSVGNVKFRNLGRIGDYWDYAGSSVPAWVSNCTVPPYLNCDGTTFSSATYPILATILGGTTLPDSKGRFRATLNQNSSRITSGSSTGGVDGNTLLASGGSQTTTLSSQNMALSPTTDHDHIMFSSAASTVEIGSVSSYASYNYPPGAGGSYTITGAGTTPSRGRTASSGVQALTVGSSSPNNFSIIPPAYIGGITMIRSA